MTKLTPRARLYLVAVEDWKAPYEVAQLLGDTPPPPTDVVKAMLGRLISRGLVQWGRANNTYRITPAGRAALLEGERDE